ncbi:Ankyrin-2 [Sticta canariensis]|nr:Ankyrin-2 [Sticta canariensis]
MTGMNTTATFSCDSNHGFQLASNFGHVNVDFHGQPNKLEEIRFSNDEKACFETIRTSNYLARKDLNPERLPGTCNWFFNHTKYQGWIGQTSGSRLLWVSADPGCGKSVLAKALVDQYDRGSVCYYFFKDDTMVTRSAAHALCAILHQICEFRPALIKHVLPMYRSNGGKLVDLFEDLWSAFVDVINDEGFGSVICILDAVDECSDDDFKKLLQKLAAIAISSTSIKILITSRPYTSIETALFHKTGLDRNEIRLSGEAEAEQSIIENEVGLYITSRVQEFRELRESINIFDNAPENLQVHLDGIKNRTYLWVSAVFSELERDVYASEYILMETINALPDNVHQAYEKILEKSPKKHILTKVLHFMLAASRPLSVMEMNMVLSIQDTSSGSPRYSGLHPANSFCKWLRDLCGFFVNIIDNKLYFAHQTAREFLVGEGACQATAGWKGSFQTDDSHTRVARVCIDYLLLMYSGSVDATFEAYATIHWPTHCQKLEVNQSLAEKVNGFLFHSNKAISPIARWTMDIQHLSLESPWNLNRRIVSSIGSPSTPFSLACSFGWPSVIRLLTSSSTIDRNQIIGEQAIGLVIAAREGHIEIVKLLLNTGADINFENEHGNTALHLAVEENHLEIVKLLLNAEADVGIKKLRKTALRIAAQKGHLEIVKLLLAAGADFDLQGVHRDTALHSAAIEGHLEIVKLLLAAGADFDIQDNNGHTALHSAAFRGHLEIVKLLLAAGADSDLQIPMDHLLAAGADINLQDAKGISALHSAASKGHLEIVKYLLAAGAEFDLQNANGCTAFCFAASSGHLEIVKLLLAAGADIDIQDSNGHTALHSAAIEGCFEIVELLLNTGADTNSQNQHGETAIQFAVEGNHLKIVKLLLKAGANFNAESESGTAWFIARERGHVGIVETLLAAGAIA